MLINELRTIPNRIFQKHRPPAFSDLEKDTRVSIKIKIELGRYGFKQLGSGAFATVYEHDNLPYVLKVFTLDNAYKDYIKLAMANQLNPCFPKFHGKLINLRNNNVFAIRMEKLEPLEFDDYHHNIVEQVKYYLDAGAAGFRLYYDENPPTYDENPPTYDIRKNKQLIKALNLIERANSIHFNDLHIKNMMIRESDNQFVITDPWV